MGRNRTSGLAFEVATRAALEMGDVRATRSVQRAHEKAEIRRSHAMSAKYDGYAQRKLEERESKALRVSLEAHHPYDHALLRAAAKRRAEADRWLAEVKARKKP